jgi:photosystem II stability/assembly factor-like uncharacterized protein
VVKFISLNVGWVAGKGSILKTINGGNTWRVVYSGNRDILQIDAVNKKYEVAVTLTGLLYSQNEGDNWNYKNYDFSSSQRQIKQVDLSGDHTAYLLSDGIVYKINLNLNDHPTLRQNIPVYVDSIYFVSSVLGFATSGNTVWRTTDSGETWTQIFQAPDHDKFQ